MPYFGIVKRTSRLISTALLISLLILLIGFLALFFGRMDETVEGYGMLEPVRRIAVAPETSGIIREMMINEGDSVEIGDTLFVLAAEDAQYELNAAEQRLIETQSRLAGIENEYKSLYASESYELGNVLADLVDAEKQVEYYRTLYDRKRDLYDQGFASEEELESAKLNLDRTESYLRVLKSRREFMEIRYERLIEEGREVVELAEKAYELAQQRLDMTAVTSPGRGVVLAADTEELVGTMATEGTPVMHIGDLSEWRFIANLTENDIVDIKTGQKAKVFMNAYPHRQYKVFWGEVSEISPVPRNTETGVVYQMELSIDEPWVEESGQRQDLRSGLTGRAEVIIESDVRIIELILNAIKK